MLNMFAQHAYILKLIPVWADVLEWPVPFRLLVRCQILEMCSH